VRTVTVHHPCLFWAVKFKQKGLFETRSTHDKVRDAHKILVGKPESRDDMRGKCIGGRIILKGILKIRHESVCLNYLDHSI
jgi:hypothetical protein